MEWIYVCKSDKIISQRNKKTIFLFLLCLLSYWPAACDKCERGEIRGAVGKEVQERISCEEGKLETLNLFVTSESAYFAVRQPHQKDPMRLPQWGLLNKSASELSMKPLLRSDWLQEGIFCKVEYSWLFVVYKKCTVLFCLAKNRIETCRWSPSTLFPYLTKKIQRRWSQNNWCQNKSK